MHLLSPYTENIRKRYNVSPQNIQMPLTLFILFHILTLAYLALRCCLMELTRFYIILFLKDKIKYPKLLFLTIQLNAYWIIKGRQIIIKHMTTLNYNF